MYRKMIDLMNTLTSHSSIISVVTVMHSDATVSAINDSQLTATAVDIVQKYSSTTSSKLRITVSSGTWGRAY